MQLLKSLSSVIATLLLLRNSLNKKLRCPFAPLIGSSECLLSLSQSYVWVCKRDTTAEPLDTRLRTFAHVLFLGVYSFAKLCARLIVVLRCDNSCFLSLFSFRFIETWERREITFFRIKLIVRTSGRWCYIVDFYSFVTRFESI